MAEEQVNFFDQSTTGMTVVESINLPENVSRHNHSPSECLALVLDSVLSRDECNALISKSDSFFTDVSKALSKYQPDRDSATAYNLAVLEDSSFANIIWSRVCNHVGPAILDFAKREGCGAPVGLCNRLRVLKYSGMDRFDPHYDRIVPDEENGCHSLITVLVYLNDGGGKEFSGGETIFLNATNVEEGRVPITPKVGRIVLFEHGLFHAGSPLTSIEPSSKLVMRTDVMFKTADCVVKQPEVLGCNMSRDDAKALEIGTGVETVTALLSSLDMCHLTKNLDEFGLLGSLEVFRLPGRKALHEMLADAGLSNLEKEALIETAFSLA